MRFRFRRSVRAMAPVEQPDANRPGRGATDKNPFIETAGDNHLSAGIEVVNPPMNPNAQLPVSATGSELGTADTIQPPPPTHMGSDGQVVRRRRLGHL
jgi:hypothetical protein